MTIRNRLKLIGLVPITLLILLSSYFFITSYINFEKATTLKTTLINNAAMDKALVNIGKENGLTALYLANDKKEFLDALNKQRETLDYVFEDVKYEVITKRDAYIPLLHKLFNKQDQVQDDPYQKFLTNAAELPETRKKKDTENVDFKSIFFTKYTEELSTPVLDKLLTVKKYSLNTEISSLISTLIVSFA